MAGKSAFPVSGGVLPTYYFLKFLSHEVGKATLGFVIGILNPVYKDLKDWAGDIDGLVTLLMVAWLNWKHRPGLEPSVRQALGKKVGETGNSLRMELETVAVSIERWRGMRSWGKAPCRAIQRRFKHLPGIIRKARTPEEILKAAAETMKTISGTFQDYEAIVRETVGLPRMPRRQEPTGQQ